MAEEFFGVRFEDSGLHFDNYSINTNMYLQLVRPYGHFFRGPRSVLITKLLADEQF